MKDLKMTLDKFKEDNKLNNLEEKKAALTIKNLLTTLDYNAEKIPVKNKDMLTRLITSLKGETLSQHELKLIDEIVEFNDKKSIKHKQ